MPFDPLYTFAQALDEIQYRFGKRNDNDFRKRSTRWLDSAQQLIAQSWLEVSDLDDTVESLPYVSGTREYDLRTTSPPIPNIVGIRYIKDNETGYRLHRFPYTEFLTIVSPAAGLPKRWTRRGYVLAYDPQPNAPGSVTFGYRRYPAYGVVELGSEWHEPLIQLACFTGWRALKDYKAAEANFTELPIGLQAVLQQPFNQMEWEAIWDDDLKVSQTGQGGLRW